MNAKLPYPFSDLPVEFDGVAATVRGGVRSERRLGQLEGIWLNEEAYRKLASGDDPVVYSVESIAPANGPGALHFGIGRIEAGRVGDEYFMTRGHLHQWRPAAEFYLGLSGFGAMLLENELTGKSTLHRLNQGDVVYVPGYTAHRTMNIGDVPLTYIGIYPAMAGHDYASIADRNFRKALVDRDGMPTLVDREID